MHVELKIIYTCTAALKHTLCVFSLQLVLVSQEHVCVMPDHAHMSHIVIVTDVFGATIAAGISIQCAAAGGDREVHGNLDSFS